MRGEADATAAADCERADIHDSNRLRHQELRHYEEGARLAGRARRRLSLPRLQEDGIDKARLVRWCGEAGWEVLLNRAGTTFRKLPDADKADLDERRAIALMLAQPSLIKRPVIETARRIVVGFKPEVYARAFASRG